MKLLAFETVTSEGKRRHLGALVEGDADSGQIIDLTSASRALLASQGVGKEESERLTALLCPPSTLGFIEGGGRAREHAEKAVEQVLTQGWDKSPTDEVIRYSASDIKHLPSIIQPPLLRDFMAFEDHLLNVFPKLNRPIPDEWYRRPVYYKGNPSSIGAHRQEIEFPEYA